MTVMSIGMFRKACTLAANNDIKKLDKLVRNVTLVFMSSVSNNITFSKALLGTHLSQKKNINRFSLNKS